MEDFIDQLSNEQKAYKLARAIRGRGAFRRFKDMVYELNLENQWYQFEADTYKKLAIQWCQDNHVDYE